MTAQNIPRHRLLLEHELYDCWRSQALALAKHGVVARGQGHTVAGCVLQQAVLI
jgi:hypothetical protein